jgi:CRISPR/Cas system CMR-associated protein Cmr3 (group 5 of RAMP superfamily)
VEQGDFPLFELRKQIEENLAMSVALFRFDDPVASTVRVQRQLDRMHDLNNGGFLAHRSRMESEDETEIRNTSDVVRTVCEGHKADHTETVFS